MAASPSSSVQQARAVIALRLRELMLDAGLTARELAVLASWHESKSSRLLNGVTAPSDADIRKWCRACSAEHEVEDLIVANRAAESMYVSWRRQHRAGMRRSQAETVPLYQRTKHFRVYCSNVVPGLLQTAEYATALMSTITQFQGTPDDVSRAVPARIDRSRVIHEGDHRFALLIEESVLHNRFGSDETMAAQLGLLLSAMGLPRVSLGVIPLGTQRERAMWTLETFMIFDEAEVQIELLAAFVTVTQPSEIAVYAEAFDRLATMAVYGTKARALVTRAIDALG